jgi:hypothetical protein
MKIAKMNRQQLLAEIERPAGGLGSRHHRALLAREHALRDEAFARAERRFSAEQAAGRKARKQAIRREARALARQGV